TGVFYIDMGFSKEVIASVSKVFGVLMTLIGAAAGGVLIASFSILSILFIGGAASAATNLLFAMLAPLGPLHAEALPSHDVISLVMALEPHVLMLV
ncbi:AmpG family muropeptide MFS transporter, partial [Pseudomonas aeruginosa]|nr:AmpG family muropeptide MFS transporter [Pseudomonas aeruginosa]